MLKNLDVIYDDLFKYLEDSIVEHEKSLSRIEKGESSISDSDYREKQSYLSLRMNTFTNNFKAFKRIVFDYEKGL
jgi:hypothetical protein